MEVSNELAEHNGSLKKIRIKDLQSTKDLTLDFPRKGVFRLDGNNDIGKSAILKGIVALFKNVNNLTYKDYISDWADSFVVEAEFWDGGTVKLSRGAVDFYEWDLPTGSGRADGTKGKVPAEVTDYFNLYEEKERTKQILNFNLPGTPLPFVDTSTLDNYWLLQRALGTEDFLLGSKQLQSRLRDTNKEIKLVFELVETQQEKLDNISNEISLDKKRINSLSRFESILKVEYEALKEMYALEKDEIAIASLQDDLENVGDIPYAEFSEIEKEGIKLSAMENTFSLEDTVSDLTVQKDTLDSLLSDLTFDTNIQDEMDVITVMAKAVNSEEELKDILVSQESVDSKLDKLSDIETVTNTLAVLKESEKIIVELSEVAELELQNKKMEDAMSKLNKEIDRLKDELGMCPFCGSDMTGAHTHN